MPKEKTLEDLFVDTLKDIYYAEKRSSTKEENAGAEAGQKAGPDEEASP